MTNTTNKAALAYSKCKIFFFFWQKKDGYSFDSTSETSENFIQSICSKLDELNNEKLRNVFLNVDEWWTFLGSSK